MELLEIPPWHEELAATMEAARQAMNQITGIDLAKQGSDKTVVVCGHNKSDFIIIDECHLVTFDVSNELAGERRWFPSGDQEISGTFKADITAEQLLALIQGDIEKPDEPPIDHRPKTDQFNPHLTKAELVEVEFPNRRQRRAQEARARRKF